MTKSAAPRLTAQEATAYEEFFVPALFGPWAHSVADVLQVRAGYRVLDVACGTGILARTLAVRAGPTGRVVGLDPLDGMLAVAAQRAPALEWRQGVAESLPFSDGEFDVVGCQFGLMFFENQARAVREMVRVLRPGGRLAVAVWGPLDQIPAYAAYVALLDRLFGRAVAQKLEVPFALGDREKLSALFREAGIDARIELQQKAARFPSLRDWILADAKGWLQLDEPQQVRLIEAGERDLATYRSASGVVSVVMAAHVVTARKSESA